jgi:hypothetical protein
VKGDRIDRVDFVLIVKVRVESIHHHHQLFGRRAASLWIYDERAIQSLMDVPLDGYGMTVVEV